jgi:hypothetical protein
VSTPSSRLESALLGSFIVVPAVLVVALALLMPRNSGAVPAYARQTGQNCVACHAGGQFPELTPYGRLFKLVTVQTPAVLFGTACERSGEGGRQHGDGVALTTQAQRLGDIGPGQMATLPASLNNAGQHGEST